jgi:hypothetical protein
MGGMRMKKFVIALSLVVAVTFSVAMAATVKGDVVNKKCPIAKKDLKADAPTSDVKKGDKEYTVGFCCKNCKGKWDAEKDPLAKWPVAEIK